MEMAAEPNFHEFDLTLTDRDLEDFLSHIEQQSAGTLPPCAVLHSVDVASVGGLQLQPHSHDSPSASASDDTGSAMLTDSGVTAKPIEGSYDSVQAAAIKLEDRSPGTLAAVASSMPGLMSSTSSLPLPGYQLPIPMVVPGISTALVSQGSMNLASSWPPQLLQPPSLSAAAVSPAMQQLYLQPQPMQQQQQDLKPPIPKQHLATCMAAATPAGLAVQQVNGSGMQSLAAAAAAAATASHASDEKLNISHSTVEKQRRDRLNSLIEELGEMVPPSDPKYCNEGPNIRRPKHVVLSDTISLLRSLQDKLKAEEAQIVQLRQQAAQATAAAEGAAAAAARTGGPTMIKTSAEGAPELPTAPDSAMNATGVVVEQGANCLYVKVNCKDRKGLLGDLVGALKSFPLVIATAAITTTKEGKVYDVFEVRLDDESVTAEDVQCAVHMALYNMEKMKGKRLRSNAPS